MADGKVEGSVEVVSGGSSVDMSGERCPYKYLGVERGCSAAEAQKAYRRLAMIWHPDRRGGEESDEWRCIAWAWGILQDPDKRAFWDGFGAELGPEGLAGEGKREAEKALLGAVDSSGNILQHARRMIRQRQEAGSQTIRQLEASCKRAEEHLKRLSGGSGRVQSAISGGIEAIRKEIIKEQWINRVMFEALSELSNYAYQEDPGSLNNQLLGEFLTRGRGW